MVVLGDLKLISDKEKLPELIPPTILVHHYVQFRIMLRQSVMIYAIIMYYYLLLHLFIVDSWR